MLASTAKAQWDTNWTTLDALTNWPSATDTYWMWQDQWNTNQVPWSVQVYSSLVERCTAIGITNKFPRSHTNYWDTRANFFHVPNLAASEAGDITAYLTFRGNIGQLVRDIAPDTTATKGGWLSKEQLTNIIDGLEKTNSVAFNKRLNWGNMYDGNQSWIVSNFALIPSNYVYLAGGTPPTYVYGAPAPYWGLSGIPYTTNTIHESGMSAGTIAAMLANSTNEYCAGDFTINAYGWPPLKPIISKMECGVKAHEGIDTPGYQCRWEKWWGQGTNCANWADAKTSAEAEWQQQYVTNLFVQFPIGGAWAEAYSYPCKYSFGKRDGGDYYAALYSYKAQYRAPTNWHNKVNHNAYAPVWSTAGGDDETYSTANSNVWNANGDGVLETNWVHVGAVYSGEVPGTDYIGDCAQPAWCDEPDDGDEISEGWTVDDVWFVADWSTNFLYHE